MEDPRELEKASEKSAGSNKYPKKRGLLARLALLAREAYERGEEGYDHLALWVEKELESRWARGEEADERALWVEALEEAIARCIVRAMMDYGLPRVVVDLERGGYIGSYERPSPGEQVRAETKEAAKREIYRRWLKRVLKRL